MKHLSRGIEIELNIFLESLSDEVLASPACESPAHGPPPHQLCSADPRVGRRGHQLERTADPSPAQSVRHPAKRSSIEVAAKIHFSRTQTQSEEAMASKAETLTAPVAGVQDREQIFDTFRRWGYLQGISLDPLRSQYLPAPNRFPIATTPEGDIAAEARAFYCGSFAIEFMHIPNLEQRQWLQDQIERPAPTPDQAHVLTQLIRADLFEQVIQQRYLGTKRFSLEGLTVLIPFLDHVFSTASVAGVTRSIIAMAHRGRLNVMTNTIGRSPSEIFAKFEDVDPRSVLGGGDVKYHMGATGEYTSPDGKTVALHLASNPSHLEAVNPVAMGRARAWQIRIGEEGRQQVLPIILHGDAAPQARESPPNPSTSPRSPDTLSTAPCNTPSPTTSSASPPTPKSPTPRFATDLAKRLPIPIFHVNGEDPRHRHAHRRRIAAEYRQRFRSDVVVDLIGYRRYTGHNETDDATVTQPRRYAAIKERPFLYPDLRKIPRRRPGPGGQNNSGKIPGRPKRRNQSQGALGSETPRTTGSPITAAHSPKPTPN